MNIRICCLSVQIVLHKINSPFFVAMIIAIKSGKILSLNDQKKTIKILVFTYVHKKFTNSTWQILLQQHQIDPGDPVEHGRDDSDLLITKFLIHRPCGGVFCVRVQPQLT